RGRPYYLGSESGDSIGELTGVTGTCGPCGASGRIPGSFVASCIGPTAGSVAGVEVRGGIGIGGIPVPTELGAALGPLTRMGMPGITLPATGAAQPFGPQLPIPPRPSEPGPVQRLPTHGKVATVGSHL